MRSRTPLSPGERPIPLPAPTRHIDIKQGRTCANHDSVWRGCSDSADELVAARNRDDSLSLAETEELAQTVDGHIRDIRVLGTTPKERPKLLPGNAVGIAHEDMKQIELFASNVSKRALPDPDAPRSLSE